MPASPSRQPRTVSMARSLFVAFGCLLVLSGGGAWLLYQRNRSGVELVHARRMIEISQRRTEVELRRLLAPISKAAAEAREWVELGLVDRGDPDALRRLFLPQLRQLPQSCSMMVSDMTGFEFLIMRNLGPGGLLTTRPEEGPWITREFRPQSWGRRSVWALWDESGRERRREWEQELDYDPRVRPWHQGPREARDPGQVHWTGIDIFFTSKTPGMTASVVARDPSGEQVVIGFDLLFSDLSRFTEQLRPSQQGQVFVVTGDGRLVGLPADPRLDDPAASAAAILQPAGSVGAPQLAAGMRAWEAHGLRELSPTRVALSSDERAWVAFRPFTIEPGRQLWIGVAVPESDLDLSAAEDLGLLGFAAVGLMLATGLTSLFSRAFAGSLHGLLAQSERIATLDLSPQELPPSRLTEVARLSSSLDRMRGALAAHVTELHRLEQARRESEGKYRRLIENMPQSYFFYAHGTDGVFTYLSPSINKVLGYTAEEFLTHYATYFTENPINEQARRSTELSIEGVRQPPYEIELLHKDGSRRRLEVLEVPVHDEAGGVVSVEGIARDMTGRREAEQELKLARDRAEAATRAKSHFVANMSHEIRTPLHAVLGLTRLLEDTELDATQQEYVRQVLESGESLLALVNDILDFSKVEAGKLEFEETPFRLRELVRGALVVVEQRAEAKAIPLRLQVAEDVPETLVGDAVRLRQILVNLLDNAVKFTVSGEVSLSVGGEEVEGGGYRLSFGVRDTGIGIPDARRGRLFLPFSQVDGSTTREFGGTGLGLAICQRLCQGMGGEIEVESEPGRGSCFYFTLVVRTACGVDLTHTAGEDVDLAQVRVLVAEDNEINQLVARRLLERLGCRVDTVGNGTAVVEAVGERSYDLVLMDLQMPGMDGLEATRRLRARTADGPGPRIVAMTANAVTETRDACLAAGMDDYLTKPVDPQALQAVVEATARRLVGR